MKVAVIGSGVGGLAVAIRLAVKGHEVDLYEKNNRAGGKIDEIRAGGYRFDAGPSLFTLPEMVEELFDLAGEDMTSCFQYTKLDVICSYFYEDGTRINAFSDPDRFAKEVEQKTGEQKSRIDRHLRKCSDQYDLTADIFLFNSLHKIRNYIHSRIFKGLVMFHKVDAMTTMHKRNLRRFKDSRVIQLFDRYATYNGSNPYIAPATLNMISHLEHNMGAYFPNEGMRSLVESLENLARAKNVRFLLSKKVERIVVEDRKATGLMIGDAFRPYDLVVSDVDIHYLYNNMLPGAGPVRTNPRDLSSSALIFYWGMRGTFDNLGLHNILFSADYKAEFQHIFERQSIIHDPTVYIFISSKMVQTDAPENCENWFVMINAPPDLGQDWDLVVEKARRDIVEKIYRVLHIRIDDFIECEEITTPKTIEKNTLSWHGALYGENSNSRYAAFLRHPFRNRSIKNLYFVGGSVHPGGGIPLCLASAKIVDQEIHTD